MTEHPRSSSDAAHLATAKLGGFPGAPSPTLSQQIGRVLDEVRDELASGELTEDDFRYLDGLADGIADALGILRSTSRDAELDLSDERRGVLSGPREVV